MTAFGLTLVQAEMRDFIVGYIAAHDGVSPSYDEIASACGLGSRGRVAFHLSKLKDRGHIDWKRGKPRSIRIVGDGLSPKLRAKLEAFCAASGDRPDDVIADAVALHLDECGAA